MIDAIIVFLVKNVFSFLFKKQIRLIRKKIIKKQKDISDTLKIKFYNTIEELKDTDEIDTPNIKKINSILLKRRKEERKFKYDIALSFAGEDREYVDQVANELKKYDIKVFYDNYRISELWGKDLYVHLEKVYKSEARFCVMFISKFYKEKLWTNLERQNAQARAFEESEEYILPARFDDTEIPGINRTTGYIDLRKITQENFVKLILEKLGV